MRLLCVGSLLAALVPVPARAHAVLVKSLPARRAVLLHPVERVRLWFNERLEPAYSVVSVWSDRERQVDLRDVEVGLDDPKQLSVGLPPLPPGRYTVRFRVLSVDGHVVEGSWSFTLNSGAAGR